MALINCPECSAEVSDKASSCVKCGHPIAGIRFGKEDSQPDIAVGQSVPIVVQTAKSRGVYIILGLLLGGLGLHNFYAGQNTRGAIKCGLLMLTFVMDMTTGFKTGFLFVWIVISAFVSLWEIITTKVDGSGAAMT